MHILAPLLLNRIKERGSPGAVVFAVEGALVELPDRSSVILRWVNIPSKEHYLVFDIGFIVYVRIVEIWVLDARCIGVEAGFIITDIEDVAAILGCGRHI